MFLTLLWILGLWRQGHPYGFPCKTFFFCFERWRRTQHCFISCLQIYKSYIVNYTSNWDDRFRATNLVKCLNHHCFVLLLNKLYLLRKNPPFVQLLAHKLCKHSSWPMSIVRNFHCGQTWKWNRMRCRFQHHMIGMMSLPHVVWTEDFVFVVSFCTKILVKIW